LFYTIFAKILSDGRDNKKIDRIILGIIFRFNRSIFRGVQTWWWILFYGIAIHLHLLCPGDGFDVIASISRFKLF